MVFWWCWYRRGRRCDASSMRTARQTDGDVDGGRRCASDLIDGYRIYLLNTDPKVCKHLCGWATTEPGRSTFVVESTLCFPLLHKKVTRLDLLRTDPILYCSYEWALSNGVFGPVICPVLRKLTRLTVVERTWSNLRRDWLSRCFL